MIVITESEFDFIEKSLGEVYEGVGGEKELLLDVIEYTLGVVTGMRGRPEHHWEGKDSESEPCLSRLILCNPVILILTITANTHRTYTI
jgi:hypothetical protein